MHLGKMEGNQNAQSAVLGVLVAPLVDMRKLFFSEQFCSVSLSEIHGCKT